ncbi:hypothetical protein HBH56_172930 [Parastagonospora nodorum]|nr:hypothetical protein HBH56_172930 [Parastagonospora nodorum]KAH3928339.1 hypothetical protein HBH54_141490 [Parastagonospora nodorum]KAH3945419.1 hypothetical protein HBH53_147010 [Parastagonospora nodorum]KAH4029280.1 hypothetical protein HBI13_046880 [Parastagonospora nodorum]KAH4038178.1 hypothetical protein HBI09_064120 [Parastagonospora nodorum]
MLLVAECIIQPPLRTKLRLGWWGRVLPNLSQIAISPPPSCRKRPRPLSRLPTPFVAMSSFPAQTSRSQAGLFQCGTCSQSYSRLDHLARHVRSHTQEKPYRCNTCDKQFSRVDLLTRHALLHTTAKNDVPNKRRRTGTTSSAPLRVSKACEASQIVCE